MAAKLQAGKLKYRITIQRNTPVTDSQFNEQIDSYSDLATISARKNDVSAGEAFRAQEIGAQITTRFTVRHSSVTSSITPKDRILFNGQVFNITAIREPLDTQNQWLEIDAVARADK